MADGKTAEQRVTPSSRFEVGKPGNPGGRAFAVQQGMAILETGMQRAAKRLVELIEHDNPAVAIAAIREVNDRVLGKPKQAVDVQVTNVAQMHLQYLQEIQMRREERMKTIEGHTQKVEVHDPSKSSK